MSPFIHFKNNLSFLILIVFFSCSGSTESETAALNIEELVPVVVNNLPKETAEQVNVEVSARLDQAALGQEIIRRWELEKLNLDIRKKDLSVEEGAELEEIDRRSFFVDESEKYPDKIVTTLYEPGYYKVKYTLTNFVEEKVEELIIKNREPVCPELYVSLNIPFNPKDSSDDYFGDFHLSAGNIDLTADFVKINFKDMMNGWYNTGIVVDPMKQFTVNSGIHVEKKIKETEKITKEFIAFSDLIQISNREKEVFFVTDQLDIRKNNLGFSVNFINSDGGKTQYSFDSCFYYSILTWGTKDGKPFFDTSFESLKNADFPFSLERRNNDVSLMSMFIGTAGIRLRHYGYAVCFSSEGIRSESIDPRGERPYPTLPYGYMLGKLGEKGTVFPIGKHFINEPWKIKNVYSYDGEILRKN